MGSKFADMFEPIKSGPYPVHSHRGDWKFEPTDEEKQLLYTVKKETYWETSHTNFMPVLRVIIRNSLYETHKEEFKKFLNYGGSFPIEGIPHFGGRA